MAELTEQKLDCDFGLVALLVGTADPALGHPLGAVGTRSEAVVLLVVGGLALFFAWLAHRDGSSRALASGVMLVVLAFLGGAVVGIDASLLALVGSLFVLLAGVLFLLEPAKKAAHDAVVAS